MSTQNLGELVPEWTVGDRLRKAREILGLEQGPFAKKLGISRGSVSNYETGATENVKPIVLRAWAMATGVSVEWLETGLADGPTPPTPPGPGKPQSDKLTRLADQKRGRTRGSGVTRRYLPSFSPEPVAA